MNDTAAELVLGADQLDHDLGHPLILEQKLQFFNCLSQPLSRNSVRRLQCKPAGVLELSFQYRASHACHLGAPLYPEFVKISTDRLTLVKMRRALALPIYWRRDAKRGNRTRPGGKQRVAHPSVTSCGA